MSSRFNAKLLLASASVLALASVGAQAQEGGATALEEIEVIGTTPLGGDDLSLDKVPANVRTIKADDFRAVGSTPTVQEQISRVTPSVNVTDVTGNPFNKEISFRGFVSSPTVGIPQGLAVYQNGVRLNEALGDTVNYDLIPQVAIERMDVWTNNPIFGLNALGGAFNFRTKSGFTFQGLELEGQVGSSGRYEGSGQWGTQIGPWAGYLSIEGARDGGWRDYSESNLKRVFGDIGYKTDSAEIHLNFTYADTKLGVVGPTPFELLEQRRRNVYTGDQIIDNQMGMVNLEGKFEVTDAWSLQTNAYYRRFKRDGVDGNDTDLGPCESNPNFLCLEAGEFEGVDENDRRLWLRDPVTGKRIRNRWFPDDEDDFGPGSTPGSIERSRIRSNQGGGTLQATNESEFFGRKNHFVVGVSYDYGKTDFDGWSEVCIIPGNLQCIETGQDYVTRIPGGIAPVSITGTNQYLGLYASDTLDITDRLSATIGARWNYAHIKIDDKGKFPPLGEDNLPTGPGLDSKHSFDRFNPMAGLTYKFTPAITGYVSYSEANRAPTPLELGCSDPEIPCPLEATLVSDPPLKQVVTRTGEAGLRGRHEFDGFALNWNASVYQANNKDDILSLASLNAGRGYFVNAGKTRRQGVELSAQLMAERWSIYANYAYVDATFRKSINLFSPNNPNSEGYGDDDEEEGDRAPASPAPLKDGEIHVKKGDRVTGIPDHQFKFGGAFRVTPQWTVGGDATIVSSQVYAGDESNQFKKLSGYAVFNGNTSFQLTENIRLFAGVKNIFDKKYETFGGFFETDDIAFLGLEDPRTLTPARPRQFYAGLNLRFNPPPPAAPIVTKY
jgi:iron complex outermembrane receptor protein